MLEACGLGLCSIRQSGLRMVSPRLCLAQAWVLALAVSFSVQAECLVFRLSNTSDVGWSACSHPQSLIDPELNPLVVNFLPARHLP